MLDIAAEGRNSGALLQRPVRFPHPLAEA
jgi:hypothetical protein